MVELPRAAAVARIFLNRPQKVNALASPILEPPAAALGEAGAYDAGRVAWLVLTGEAIDAERAYEWGLVEALCDEAALDQHVAHLVAALLAGDRTALRMQKELLQQWEEQPLAACIAGSVERFAEAYAGGAPMRRVR